MAPAPAASARTVPDPLPCDPVAGGPAPSDAGICAEGAVWRADAVHLAALDPHLAEAAAVVGLLPVRRRPPGFATLLGIILEQQVSTAAARAMWVRLETRLGAVAPEPFLALDDATLRACGFSRQKARYGRALAEEVREGRLDLGAVARLDDEAALVRLSALPGIGRWSAENYLLWALGRRDIWPAQDMALQTGWHWLAGTGARPSAQALREIGEAWRPRRTAAALLIWHYYLARVAARRRNRGAGAKEGVDRAD